MILLLIFKKKLQFLIMNSFQILANFLVFLLKKTDKYLSTVTFYKNEIKKAIHNNLDPNNTKLTSMACLVFTFKNLW